MGSPKIKNRPVQGFDVGSCGEDEPPPGLGLNFTLFTDNVLFTGVKGDDLKSNDDTYFPICNMIKGESDEHRSIWCSWRWPAERNQ